MIKNPVLAYYKRQIKWHQDGREQLLRTYIHSVQSNGGVPTENILALGEHILSYENKLIELKACLKQAKLQKLIPYTSTWTSFPIDTWNSRSNQSYD